MIVTRDYLPTIREKHEGQMIVYCSGNFDLAHARHIMFLTRCKTQGDVLVVGVGPDHDIKINKGNNRPIQSEQVRLYTVDNLKPVDYCCLNRQMMNGYHRLYNEEETFQLLHPDIYIINDDAYDIPFRQQTTCKYGIRLIIGKREANIPPFLKNISTTELIQLIQERR